MDALPIAVRRLIKPRLALSTYESAGSLAGAWGGRGVVPLPDDVRDQWPNAVHRISVDCDWLERNGFGVRGCLSVYELSACEFVAVNDPDATFVPVDGEPLYGIEEISPPEEDALNASLTAEERTHLGYDTETGYARLGTQYAAEAQAGCPIFRSDLVAVLGGWHISWPEGPPRLPLLAHINERCDRAGGPGCLDPAETYPIDPYRLVLWTLRDAEPWVEVLVGPDGDLHTLSHVT